MAGEIFELLVSYPDGHIEIIEETFYNLEKARDYGVSIMNQIAATEQFHKHEDGVRLQKPYFEIYRKAGGERELVEKGKGK